MISDNPYLTEFLENSRRLREEISKNPNLVRSIEEKLRNEDGWNRGTFTQLVPDRFGLKKREPDQVIVEVTSIADIYRSDLHISPFVVLYEGQDGEMAYIVKDLGEIPIADNSYKGHGPIREAIEHMRGRGYGTHSQSSSGRGLFTRNLWGNIFVKDLALLFPINVGVDVNHP